LIQLQIFQSNKERLGLGIEGTYPDHLIETTKDKTDVRHTVNEQLTLPWLRHFFMMQALRETNAPEETIARDNNLIEVLKTTIPLTENSFTESTMSSWRMFIDNAFRDTETPWYSGIRRTINPDRFNAAIEQLELEIPVSNAQRAFQFYDQTRTLRKMPRVPMKLFFALPGNEKEKLLQILRQAINNNPHNVDIALVTYCFLKAWDRATDFLLIAQQENRRELEEWYYWVEGNMKSLSIMKRAAADYAACFYIYDRATLTGGEYKDAADWFLKENEFKSAYHFYSRAKEYEIALELLQNISVKEFADLINMRRISKGEKPFDISGDSSGFTSLYQEEMDTLRGFVRIRVGDNYRQRATRARQHFDRETIETKYAFGELTDDEYQRLIRQLQERKQ
jgi:hypothetical protein